MRRYVLTGLLSLLVIQNIQGQEIQARVSIIANKVSTTVDRKIFQTLQTGLTNFINNRKWTNDAFQPSEKIQCSFLITIDEAAANNIYKGKITVQAARPVYNSSYVSPILNYIDDGMTFRYVEFQPIEFNENRVQGNDPYVANITAVLAFYVNIILGLDYASFNLRAGDPYFQKAWNIVNNAPESGRDIGGWKSFEGFRNRYWLAENLNNSRFALIHDALYSYYRSGMDLFYENEEAARTGILNCLNFLSNLNRENPNSMIVQVFFQGKATELVKVFSKANPDLKNRAADMLIKLDLTNASLYKELK
jgi:hypothetical protein